MYCTTSGRLTINPHQARDISDAHWLHRLAYNATIGYEHNQIKHRQDCITRGRELPKRASKFDLNMQLNSLRQDDAAGPALVYAIKFPVTMQRQAVGEAHDAMSRTISKWAKGERANIPKRRSVYDEQSMILSNFSIKEKGNKLLVEIKGIGVCKFKPSRFVQIDKIVSVVFTRTPSGKNTMSVVTRQEDIEHGAVLLAAGQAIHEAVRHLPENAPHLDFIRAAEAAGLVIRGADVVLGNPTTTSDNLNTQAVRRVRSEVAVVKEYQREEIKRPRGKKRSDELKRLKFKADSAWKKHTRRRETRAYQDSAMLVRGLGEGQGNPFLKKTTPEAAKDAARSRPILVAMEKREFERGTVKRNSAEADDKELAMWKRRMATAMNRRTAETGMAMRIRRVNTLAQREGILCYEVEPRNTTQECSRCTAIVPKLLGDRVHECPHCGLNVSRDLNGSWNILGRALKRFHASSDPGGEIAEGIRLRQEQRDKDAEKKERRVAAGRKRLGKGTKGVVALQHHKEMS